VATKLSSAILYRAGFRSPQPTLAAALLATFLVNALFLVELIIHLSPRSYVAAFIRLLLIGILSALVLRGSAPARWLLLFWYAFYVVTHLISLITIPLRLAGFSLLLLVCYLWSVVELARRFPSASPEH
jgi:hypothetical protein